MANDGFTAAKKAKNDEFYTHYADIEKEMNAYLDYDPDVFRGKTILLPCDDPEWSNFPKYAETVASRCRFGNLNCEAKTLSVAPPMFKGCATET